LFTEVVLSRAEFLRGGGQSPGKPASCSGRFSPSKNVNERVSSYKQGCPSGVFQLAPGYLGMAQTPVDPVVNLKNLAAE
jgi:hypothetical protein